MTMFHRVLTALALVPLSMSAVGAQAVSATVQATVHDSLSNAPLRGATVQLVSASDWSAVRTGVTDSLGGVVFREVPSGSYRVGFIHPLLDELGVSAAEREVRLASDETQRVELSVPSPARLRVAVCGAEAAGDSSTAIVGTVRDPRDRLPVAGASVTVEWVELTLSGNGMQRQAPRHTATTGPNGWFALCGLPSGVITVHARQASDSTPRLDFQLAAREFRRRDLYLSMAGTGELRGQVVSADSARALAGARVTVVGGRQGETGASGEFRLGDVPLGTQLLEVRAVGYFPERQAVDVTPESSPLSFALRVQRAVLDPVRVTADRAFADDLEGLRSRHRRSGMGRYLSAEQIAARNVQETSDLLRTIPGFIGDDSLSMRSNFSDRSRPIGVDSEATGSYGVNCKAEVYVDGHLIRGITTRELDLLVKPEHIVGIEVYAAGSPKPPQFDSGMSGCGSLVIWQVPLKDRARR